MFEVKGNVLKVFSLLFAFMIVLSGMNVSYAESQGIRDHQLFSDSELQEIQDYMNENMNVFYEENLGIPQIATIELENGDEVEIIVVNEIDTTTIAPNQAVLPGQNRVVSVTKNRTGFLGGSMTTRAGYSTVSGSNNIQMRARYVQVNGVAPQGYTLRNNGGYFTSNGPSRVLHMKSYQEYGLLSITLQMKLDLTLTGGYNKVTTTYVWNQG